MSPIDIAITCIYFVIIATMIGIAIFVNVQCIRKKGKIISSLVEEEENDHEEVEPKQAIITLGFPASGKSTFLTKLGLDESYKLFDPDLCGSELSYRERNAKNCQDIINHVNSGDPQSFIISASSGGANFEDTLKFLKEHDYEIIILWVDAALEDAKKRNMQRDRHVPDKAYDTCLEFMEKNVEVSKKYTTFVYKIQLV